MKIKAALIDFDETVIKVDSLTLACEFAGRGEDSIKLNEEGTIYQFTTNGCIVEKKVAKIADSEPEIIRLMFENKTFVCTYEKGAFDERLLTTLLSGLERCEGDLKTSLYELALAQYELNLEVYEI